MNEELTEQQRHDRIRQNMLAEEAWPDGTTRDEKRLRGLLAHRVGITYGDDGELQSGEPSPAIDFKRDSVDEIERKLGERGMAALVAPRVEHFPTWADGMERAAELCEEEANSAQAVLNEHPNATPRVRERVEVALDGAKAMAKTIRAFKDAGPHDSPPEETQHAQRT